MLPNKQDYFEKGSYLTKIKQAVTIEIVSDIPKSKSMWEFRRHWFTWNKGYLKNEENTDHQNDNPTTDAS